MVLSAHLPFPGRPSTQEPLRQAQCIAIQNSKSTRGILRDAAAPDHSAMLIAATKVQYRGPFPEIDWSIPVKIQKNTNADLNHIRLARGSGRMSSLLHGVECGLAENCAIASRLGQEIRLDQRVALPSPTQGPC